MLDAPFHGWVQVTIGPFSEPASYLENTPVDLLKGILNCLNKRKTKYIIHIDSEGYDSKIKFFDDYIEIKTDKERDYGFNKIIVSKNIKEVAEEVIQDIENHFDEFCKWNPEADMEMPGWKENMEQQKVKLEGLIYRIKKLI